MNRVRSGTELVAIWMLNSQCGASAYPALPAASRQVQTKLREYVRRTQQRLVVVGVDLDGSGDGNSRLLSTFGEFDETLVGGGWLSSAALSFLVRDNPGPLAVPQLVLIEREILAKSSGLRVSTDRVIARKVGYDEIMAFANDSVR